MDFNEISFRVRYGETDQMGIVYHGNYPQYLEMGRIAWLRALGISYKSMEENGVLLPIVSMQINYQKSALFDDQITVRTTLVKTPMARIEFDYVIYRNSDEILATGNTVLAFVDKMTKRPLRCPNYLLEKLKKD